MENRERKVYDFIKGNLINFIIVLTAIGYLVFGMITIEQTGLKVWEVVGKAGLSLIIGFLIKQAMSENGFNYGYRSEIWSDALDKYSKTCDLANPYIEKVDNFYASEEIEKKKAYRRANLMAVRLKYDWFFDDEGNYIKNVDRENQLDKKQKKVLKKCVKVKIYQLNLFSEYSNLVDADTKRERTDKDQRAKMVGKNSVAQLIAAIVGAYFVPIFNWDWASFVMSSIQLVIWIGCGITQLYTNYNYVVIEKVGKLARKKELIIKFVRGCEKGLYEKNPYDEKEQVNEENI